MQALALRPLGPVRRDHRRPQTFAELCPSRTGLSRAAERKSIIGVDLGLVCSYWECVCPKDSTVAKVCEQPFLQQLQKVRTCIYVLV